MQVPCFSASSIYFQAYYTIKPKICQRIAVLFFRGKVFYRIRVLLHMKKLLKARRFRHGWRRHPDLNWGVRVLQTLALPLGYGALSKSFDQGGNPSYKKMERETRFELATFALARRRSTTEPFPHQIYKTKLVGTTGLEPVTPCL